MYRLLLFVLFVSVLWLGYGTPPSTAQEPIVDTRGQVAERISLSAANPKSVGSENVDIVGHMGGEARVVAVQDNYAYVGMGLNLMIFDVATPVNPTVVGQIVMPGIVDSIALSENYAYLAVTHHGLNIVDISDPTAPVRVGFVEFSGVYANERWSVAISDNYAYVVVADTLHVVNVSNPAAPTQLSSFSSRSISGGVVVYEEYLYIATQGGLQIVNISNPAKPKWASFYDTSGYARGIDVVGDYAYVTDEERGLHIVDVSDPATPTQVSFYAPSGKAGAVVVAGAYAYVAYLVDQYDHLRVIDISNPAAPTQVGFYDISGGASDYESYSSVDLAIANNHIFATQMRGLLILDASHPIMPTEVALYENLCEIGNFILRGKVAYTSESNKLCIFDMSNPAQPREISSYQIVEEELEAYDTDLVIDGNYAYVLLYNDDEVLNREGLHILDISTPTSPVEVGFFADELAGGGDVSGTYFYLARRSQEQYILDLSDRTNPTKISSYTFSQQVHSGMDITVAGDYAYLSARDGFFTGFFEIVDVSNITAPKPVALYDTDATVYDMIIRQNYAYLAVGQYNGGLHTYDVSNPNVPVLVSLYEAPENTGFFDLTIVDNYAYAVGETGLYIFDMSLPTAPTVVVSAFQPARSWLNSVTVEGGYIYVTGEYGLTVLRFAPQTISGQVNDESGNPLADVTVSAGQSSSSTTDENGTYTFNVSPGTHRLTAYKSGYLFTPRTITVPPDATGQNFTAIIPTDFIYLPVINKGQ